MNIIEAIAALEKHVSKPSEGLPDEVFFYISRTTPLVNVDLLIKDDKGRVLLSWRNDPYAGIGWHLPGGILRFRERLEARIKKVAEIEIGVPVNFDPNPIALNQLIYPTLKNRSHFVSLLYKCLLPVDFIPQNKGISCNDAGYLKWHQTCPDNLLKYHEIYKKFL